MRHLLTNYQRTNKNVNDLYERPTLEGMMTNDKQSERLNKAVAYARTAGKMVTRADLLLIADKYRVPFRTFVERLESERLIPFGTYRELMHRIRTVDYLRKLATENLDYVCQVCEGTGWYELEHGQEPVPCPACRHDVGDKE